MVLFLTKVCFDKTDIFKHILINKYIIMKRILFLSLAFLLSLSLTAQNTLSKKFGNSSSSDRIEMSKKDCNRSNNELSVKLLEKANVKSVVQKSNSDNVKNKSRNHRTLSQVRNVNKQVKQINSTRAIIWTDDFSVASNWTIGNSAGNTQDWVIGTAAPVGTYSSGMGTISSPTAANGFALYDSDAIGVPTNSVGDQDAFVRTTNSINLTGHSLVKVKFYQSYRKYNSQTFVGVKVGANAWVEIEVNDNMSANDMVEGFKEVDISAIAGGQSNVKIQFRYYGEWDYAWMVDDVSVEDAFVNDAATQFVFTLGELPVGQSNQVSALIENVGAGNIASVDVTLSITGANTFSNVQTVTNLLIGESVLVSFATYTPTAIGVSDVSVSVASDNNNPNNSFSYYQSSDNEFAYADTSDNSGSLGYNTGSGLMLAKYNAGPACSVNDIEVYISDSAAVGNTVYGVVVNSSGAVVAQSTNHVVALSDLHTWVNFPVTGTTGFTNEDFYAGLAQTANSVTGYYPLSTQSELYIRDGAYYISGLTGGTINEANTYGRFMIRANLGTSISDDIGIVDLISPNNQSSCSLTANEVVTVAIENFGSQSASGFTVSYSIDGGIVQTEIVATTIPAGVTQNYTFTGTIDMSAVQQYEILTYVVLSGDQNTINDTLISSVTNGDATITVDILTDAYPEETAWGLFNTVGELVYVGGGYTDTATLYSEDVCVLSSECYTFLIIDDYSDGIFQPGYYQVSYNNVMIGGNTNFTSAEEWVYNIGGGCPANELGVDMVYTLGQLPKNQGSPHYVSALIYNYGTDTQTNVSVSLDISGSNSFTDTYVIPAILSGEEITVTFAAYNPTIQGLDDITVSVPNDDDNSNNSYSQYQNVNNTTFSYADTSAIAGGIGYNTGEGLLFNKHFMNGSGEVTHIGIMVSNDASAVGNEIYAVVLDSDTLVVGQSSNYLIQSTDLGTVVYLELIATASFNNEIFFAGMAQLENVVTGYFPLATQDEPFTRDDTYFGSALDGSGAVDYTSLGRFNIEAVLAFGPDWTFNNTGTNHTILIPNTAPITINGVAIEVGDYIGVFYDESGVEACGGYVMYDGVVVVMTAWGAQAGFDDGFQPNEVFIWKIWDATDESVTNATANYNTLDFPNGSDWVVNGMSGLYSLTALTQEVQTVSIPDGWSIFSTYIDVFEPNLDSIFAPIIADVSIIKNGAGLVFWPPWVNGIGDVVIGEGYQIKLVGVQVVDFVGISVVPETATLNYLAGWSIIGYLRQAPADIATMMAPIATYIDIMKNGSGLVFWPLWGVNGIGDMIPGEGYQMKLSAAQTFSFPANISPSMKSHAVQNTVHYKVKINTGHNMTVGFPASCLDNISNGDEIAAFNNQNEIVGYGLYTNGNFVLTVWGNDDSNSIIDGMLFSEDITFKVWNNFTNEESTIIVTEWTEGNGSYNDNNIDIVKSIQIVGQSKLLHNYPNPFSTNTEISFLISKDSKVTIELYNVLGSKLETITSRDYTTGLHSVLFDGSSYSNGTYFYRIVSNNFIETKSLTIQK